MTNQKKFEHSVNVLLKALLNNTLVHGRCKACAVGNLIAASLGINIYLEEHDWPKWRTNLYTGHEWLHPEFDEIETANFFYRSVGYTQDQIYKIEHAFEAAPMYDDWVLNGLMAVVDVLAEIHEIDLTTVKETKELFV